MSGILIAIDGVDGCGKSTQVRLLAEKIKKDFPDQKVLVTREPWDVEENLIGKKIRSILNRESRGKIWADDAGFSPEALQYLFFLDRCVHYMKVIVPALLGNHIVITDRERMVTYAYGLAGGVDVSVIDGWHKDLYTPDQYFYIKVDSDTASRRINERNMLSNTNIDYFENPEKVKKNVEGFDKIASLAYIANLAVVDGGGSPEQVADLVYQKFLTRYKDLNRRHN